jgi:hypothetical protein
MNLCMVLLDNQAGYDGRRGTSGPTRSLRVLYRLFVRRHVIYLCNALMTETYVRYMQNVSRLCSVTCSWPVVCDTEQLDRLEIDGVTWKISISPKSCLPKCKQKFTALVCPKSINYQICKTLELLPLSLTSRMPILVPNRIFHDAP